MSERGACSLAEEPPAEGSPASAAQELARLRVLLAQKDREQEELLSWLSQLQYNVNDTFWTYVLADRTLRVFSFDDLNIIQSHVVEDGPEATIRSHFVHPDSASAYREFFQAMADGRAEDSVHVMLRTRAQDAHTWCTLSYRMQYDEDGRPVRAVGLRREVDNPHETQRWYASIPDSLYPHLLHAGMAHYADNRMDRMLFRTDEQTQLSRDIPLDEAIESTLTHLFTDGERRAYRDLVSPEPLIKRYEAGRRWSIGRFRMLVDGTVHPVRVAVNVRKDASEQLVGHAFTSFCDQRSGWEANTDVSVMRDPETQLYMRDFARLMAESVLRGREANDLSAVTIIRGFEVEPVPRRIRLDLAMAVSVYLDTDCICYRYDDVAMGAFFPSISSDEAHQHRIAEAIAAARASLVDANAEDASHLENLRIVAETVYATSDFLEVSRAADQAREACELHADAPNDIVGEPVSQHAVLRDGDEAAMDEHRAIYEIDELDGGELYAFASIRSAMLNSGSSLQSINAALRGLGMYYRASRVYIAAVTARDGMLSIPFEWADSASASIKSRFSNSAVTRFPFIMRNINANKPVYVSKPRMFTRPDAPGVESTEPWRFCLIPISQSDERSLALCVDNPHTNYDRWELASCVATRVYQEWKLFSYSRRKSRNATLAELGALPGNEALEHTMSQAGSGLWSSFGAFVVMVPQVEVLVAQQGFTHALEVYASIKATLEESFEATSVFQTGDAEFVALFPNSSYHAFIQRCAQARTALVVAHPHETHIGSAWSDDTDNCWGVIEEARVIATHDTGASFVNTLQEVRAASSIENALPDSSPFVRAQEFSRRFTVYLQPKIDLRTGALVGAEALARVIDDEGRAGSPVREIERLEANGEISTLDYYVFDYALSLMSAWRQKGYQSFPISSNFSRSTLLGTTALASVLAIMSRYPSVPPGLLEMEVTESSIDLGSASLGELVNRYRSIGLRVALDDFGSHYSNVSVLASVHFDTIKLDRSLVLGVPDNDVSCTVVRNIAEICASQNMACVAEGVERPDQVAALEAEGCHVCQGFYYDKPMPAELFERKYLSA